MEDKSASTTAVFLRDLIESDLPIFFQQQLDASANYMAAFTAKDPASRAGFDAHWVKIRNDSSITIRTIVLGKTVIGYLACFEREGEPEITYWLGKPYWGRGIATRALVDFLRVLKKRPLFARAAKDNVASIRVLEKCGFTNVGCDKFFANARGCEIEEVIMKLH